MWITRFLFQFEQKKQTKMFGGKCSFDYRAKCSASSVFEGNNAIGSKSFFEGTMGYGSYMANDSRLCLAQIGKYCCIGADVCNIIGNHPTRDWVSTHPAFFSCDPVHRFTYVSKTRFKELSFASDDGKYLVEIGNDVWIGDHVRILSGTHIGDGAIIAAGAVVAKDVPPYAIVGGVPAKLIRYRFTQEQIDRLLQFKWWNREEEWIKKHSEYFSDINQFMSIVESD